MELDSWRDAIMKEHREKTFQQKPCRLREQQKKG